MGDPHRDCDVTPRLPGILHPSIPTSSTPSKHPFPLLTPSHPAGHPWTHSPALPNSKHTTHLSVENTHRVSEPGAGLPASDDHQRIPCLDELAVLAEVDGVLDAELDVLQPVGHALGRVDQGVDAAVQVTLTGHLGEPGHSDDRAWRTEPARTRRVSVRGREGRWEGAMTGGGGQTMLALNTVSSLTRSIQYICQRV